MQKYFEIEPHLIGFDFDCVVADTMEAFIRLAAEDYGFIVRPEEITCYQVENCLNLPHHIIQEIFMRLLNHPVENNLKPMPHAISVLAEVAKNTHVNLITARPNSEPVQKWLANHLPSDLMYNFRLITTGQHDGKSYYIKQLGLQFFVDDRLETCFELADAGLHPVVFSHPWNYNQHPFFRAETWLDIREILYL